MKYFSLLILVCALCVVVSGCSKTDPDEAPPTAGAPKDPPADAPKQSTTVESKPESAP